MTMKTILLVDDEPEIQQILEEELSDCGYKVLTAVDGQKALEIFNSHEISFVISDVRMPNMDGIELLKSIRKTKQTPFLFVSAYGDISLSEARSLGALDIVNKPYLIDDVVDRVEQIAPTNS